MDALSYKDWHVLGYQVRRGERSKTRNRKGVPLFTQEQVDAIPRRSAIYDPGDYDLEELEFFDMDNGGWGTG